MTQRCTWDRRPAMPNWRETWKQPLCEHCSQFLLGLMAGEETADFMRIEDDVAQKSKADSRKVLDN